MYLELLESLIEQDFGYTHTGNWGKSQEHSSLVVDRQKELWFWNSRDMRGNVKDYLLLIRGYSEAKATEFLKSKSNTRILELPESDEASVPYEKLVEFLWLNGKNNRDYWYRRGLNDNVIDRFKLGFSGEFFTIPIYVNGEFKNFQCRKDIPEKKIRPWYRHSGPLMFNSDILQFVNKVFITEGPVDAILLTQLGYTAVSHTAGATGWNNEWFKYFFKQKEIIYIADNDQAGIAGAKRVAKCLGETRVRILRFADKAEKYDTVDFFRDGGTKQEFEQRLSSDLKYSFEGI
jgi:DNA primase